MTDIVKRCVTNVNRRRAAYDSFVSKDNSCRRGWIYAYWFLTAIFVGTAALNLLHARAGFFTNYLADLAVPAWLYVIMRGLAGKRTTLFFAPWIGATPERAAIVLFVASAASELSQRWWPRGFFAGHFDPLDIAAYAIGIGICYAFDRRCMYATERASVIPSRRSPV